MAEVLLKGGPCDPRTITMSVTVDAQHVSIRPMPFDCHDVYAITDRFVEHDQVTHATGEYLYTSGPRVQREKYRKTLLRLGTGRAFAVKTEAQGRRVH